jgi:signal transduction histidine kinase
MMTGEHPRNRPRAGVRVQVTLVATVVVAAALIAAAAALWVTVRVSLYDGLREGAEQDASAVSSQLEASGASALGELDDDRLLQVVDASGRVVARSEGAPLTPVASGRQAGQIVHVDGAAYVVAVEQANSDNLVIAGRQTEAAELTIAAVATFLAIGVPILVAIVGTVSWVGTGRALRPVERLRREVGDVTAVTLNRRVDEPGTKDEVDRLAHTLNDMLARLNVAQASQQRFISDASHELRSPLAVLRQYAELSRDHPERLKGGELARVVLDEGSRLESLVGGMLVLARADEATLRLDRRDVDLDDLLLVEAERLRGIDGPDVATTGITAVRVRGDRALLSQMVRNLVDNAARHANARIALSVQRGAGSAILVVSDDGPGVPAVDRDRAFERFVRLDPGRGREHGGGGLGLAIVAEIVRAHGGTARIEQSGELGGARLVVELPGVVDA